MDGLLTAIANLTQLALIVMGAYVSFRPPKNHWRWIDAFIVVGLAGVGVTVWLAHRASNAQEAANVQISKAVTAATDASTPRRKQTLPRRMQITRFWKNKRK